ncbi:tetratricopeptide repeat protein [Erythrobacteraceae bacterium E2-1 Yellow Sea]|nr:tetratricopeptide repeat protein [Erythrobacteraceae bacterium E2-1 Yellow Sea]
MTLPIAPFLLPLLMQAGPNPYAGAIPDYSAEVQDRPARIENTVNAQAKPSWLEECLELVDSDPARAHSRAQIQRETATGNDRILANHCLGLAATKLSLWTEARAAFLAGRDEVPADDLRMRARLGAMAGNAAQAQGDRESALNLLKQAYDNAQSASAGDLQAFIALDVANLQVQAGQLESAAAMLAEARRLQPTNPDSWLLSATLMRRRDRLDEAQVEIEEAARLNPTDPQIALEAGVIAILDGRDDAARQSWDSVLTLEPEGPAADTARYYLEQLGGTQPNQ